MGWYSNTFEKLKQLSNPQLFLFIGAKVIGGFSLGILVATWLPTWTWWIFMIIALVIGIPAYGKLFGK